MRHLLQADEDIWTYDGSAVPFYGMAYTTRMTVIRLKSGAVWIHSPSEICDDLISEIQELGEVEYLISPNKIHHLFLQDWIDLFPNAKVYSSPGLENKRKDIVFDGELTDRVDESWKGEIEQLIFKGSSCDAESRRWNPNRRHYLFVGGS